MNIVDHPNLDQLYRDYTIDIFDLNQNEESIQIRCVSGEDQNHLIATKNKRTRNIHIDSLEGVGIGHKLMILFLIEAFHQKALKITLDSRTKDSSVIPQEQLDNFYRKFGFSRIRESPLGDGASYMEGIEWTMAFSQIEKYIQKFNSLLSREDH